eukprot:g44368.t1
MSQKLVNSLVALAATSRQKRGASLIASIPVVDVQTTDSNALSAPRTSVKRLKGEPSGEKKRQRRGPDLSHTNLQDPLSDVMGPGLDMLWCGINPGRVSAAAGFHYANSGNHFWKLLYESGLTDKQLKPAEQQLLLNYGMGLINLVQRMTPSSSDLSRKEMEAGKAALLRKLQESGAHLLVFNGRCIFDAILGAPKIKHFSFGLQEEAVSQRLLGRADVRVFVMPSTSSRVSAYQRRDKLIFFQQLKEVNSRRKEGNCDREGALCATTQDKSLQDVGITRSGKQDYDLSSARVNSSLTQLLLWNNKIGNAGAIAIGKGLEV